MKLPSVRKNVSKRISIGPIWSRSNGLTAFTYQTWGTTSAPSGSCLSKPSFNAKGFKSTTWPPSVMSSAEPPGARDEVHSATPEPPPLRTAGRWHPAGPWPRPATSLRPPRRSLGVTLVPLTFKAPKAPRRPHLKALRCWPLPQLLGDAHRAHAARLFKNSAWGSCSELPGPGTGL